MKNNSKPEVWLRGPIEKVPAQLMPVAHALLQAREDVSELINIDKSVLWERPNGAASVGFHLLHVSGSLDRLMSYAKAKSLTEEQRQALAVEKAGGDSSFDAEYLVRNLAKTIDKALQQLQETPEEIIFAERKVGSAGLPSSVLGLLFHAAEHTQRHVGQLMTTLKVIG